MCLCYSGLGFKSSVQRGAVAVRGITEPIKVRHELLDSSWECTDFFRPNFPVTLFPSIMHRNFGIALSLVEGVGELGNCFRLFNSSNVLSCHAPRSSLTGFGCT